MLDLGPIKDRAAKITPGPFDVRPVSNGGNVGYRHPMIMGAGGKSRVAYMADGGPGRAVVAHEEWANAEFFAHAPDDISALIVELERLRKENTELSRAIVPVLVHVEPVLYRARVEIDKKVEEARANARIAQRQGGEPWVFSTEYRQSLEREIEPLVAAVREANAVYDQITGTE
jgi:hypothetical protein